MRIYIEKHIYFIVQGHPKSKITMHTFKKLYSFLVPLFIFNGISFLSLNL